MVLEIIVRDSLHVLDVGGCSYCSLVFHETGELVERQVQSGKLVVSEAVPSIFLLLFSLLLKLLLPEFPPHF